MQALNTILYNHLSGHALWGDRVYPVSVAPALVERPYVLFFWAGGGFESMAVNRRNVRVTLTVKGVATEQATALAIKGALAELLAEAGAQDVGPQLLGHGGWEVTTITQDRIVYLEEALEGAQWIYHAGNQYVVTMEAF